MSLPRMTRPEILQFVLGYCDNQLFTSIDVTEPRLLGLVFMPLLFLDLPESDKEELGCVWEYYSAAGPRSINGLPAFTSMRIMHKEDLLIAAPLIASEMQRRKEFLEQK